MTRRDTRSRLAAAALELFESQGFDNTTIDEIVARAGVSKTTFFRHFRAKEEVIFPDHEGTLADIATMFDLSDGTDRLATVCAAAKHVLSKYVDEGEVARSRFRLTSSVVALRDAEVASIQRYHRAFQRYLIGDGEADWQRLLTTEVQAASVIAANNFVVRSWLRGDIDDPLAAFDQARSRLLATDWTVWNAGEVGRAAGGSTIVVLETDRPLGPLLELLQRTLGTEVTDAPASTQPPVGPDWTGGATRRT